MCVIIMQSPAWLWLTAIHSKMRGDRFRTAAAAW